MLIKAHFKKIFGEENVHQNLIYNTPSNTLIIQQSSRSYFHKYQRSRSQFQEEILIINGLITYLIKDVLHILSSCEPIQSLRSHWLTSSGLYKILKN